MEKILYILHYKVKMKGKVKVSLKVTDMVFVVPSGEALLDIIDKLIIENMRLSILIDIEKVKNEILNDLLHLSYCYRRS